MFRGDLQGSGLEPITAAMGPILRVAMASREVDREYALVLFLWAPRVQAHIRYFSQGRVASLATVVLEELHQ